MARSYYSGQASSKQMEEVELLLAQYGITEEQIRAKAMQICGPVISRFNRMETNCETSLRILRKDHDRRREVKITSRALQANRMPRASYNREIERS